MPLKKSRADAIVAPALLSLVFQRPLTPSNLNCTPKVGHKTIGVQLLYEA